MAVNEPTQAEDFAALYRQAFKDFGVAALWSNEPVPEPTPADALALRRMAGWPGGG